EQTHCSLHKLHSWGILGNAALPSLPVGRTSCRSSTRAPHSDSPKQLSRNQRTSWVCILASKFDSALSLVR
ncbi:hypothetical protein PMAYCL1PPCAC_16580, partial [Pristionchus mayeri]